MSPWWSLCTLYCINRIPGGFIVGSLLLSACYTCDVIIARAQLLPVVYLFTKKWILDARSHTERCESLALFVLLWSVPQDGDASPCEYSSLNSLQVYCHSIVGLRLVAGGIFLNTCHNHDTMSCQHTRETC